MNLRRILLTVLAILLAVGIYAQGDLARVGASVTGVLGDAPATAKRCRNFSPLFSRVIY